MCSGLMEVIMRPSSPNHRTDQTVQDGYPDSWSSIFSSPWERLKVLALSQSCPRFKKKRSMSTFEPNTKRRTLGIFFISLYGQKEGRVQWSFRSAFWVEVKYEPLDTMDTTSQRRIGWGIWRGQSRVLWLPKGPQHGHSACLDGGFSSCLFLLFSSSPQHTYTQRLI